MYEVKYHDVELSNYGFLVTGGAGFIGSHIVEYLLKYGAGKVRVLDSFLTGRKENIAQFMDFPNFELIEGDIRDYKVCEKACKGMNFVAHQAALGSVPRSVEDPILTNAINVDGFLNVMMAGKAIGVKRFVYASSSSVYGNNVRLPKIEEEVGAPLSPYAITKKTNELYSHVFSSVYHMEIVGLRYFNIFGPRQDPSGPYAAVIPLFIDRLITNQKVHIHGDGEQSRDFTFVENAVQANVKALLTENREALGEVFNVGAGNRYTINELFSAIKVKLNKKSEAVHEPERAGDIKHSLADISKGRRLLGYDPGFDLEAGLDSTVPHFVGNKYL